MKINELNKVSTPENLQSQTPSVSVTPKLQAGVGSIPDGFEASTKPSLLDVLQNKFRESLNDMNKDKKSYLEKLAEHNEAADQLSEYLEDLVDASEKLAAQEKGKEEDDAAPVISSQATKGSAVREAAEKRNDDPFVLKINK